MKAATCYLLYLIEVAFRKYSQNVYETYLTLHLVNLCNKMIVICSFHCSFHSHKISQLSRVVRMIGIIWIVAFCLALPQAAQFGIIDEVS